MLEVFGAALLMALLSGGGTRVEEAMSSALQIKKDTFYAVDFMVAFPVSVDGYKYEQFWDHMKAWVHHSSMEIVDQGVGPLYEGGTVYWWFRATILVRPPDSGRAEPLDSDPVRWALANVDPGAVTAWVAGARRLSEPFPVDVGPSKEESALLEMAVLLGNFKPREHLKEIRLNEYLWEELQFEEILEGEFESWMRDFWTNFSSLDRPDVKVHGLKFEITDGEI